MTARHTRTRSAARGGAALRTTGRRLTALVELLLVVTVPPAVLLTLVGSPLDPPAMLRHRDALTSPVDDRTLLWLIGVFAWLAYSHLLACLTIEALRQTRGSTLHVPLSRSLFGGSAALAGHLIAGLLLTSQPATGGPGTFTPALLHTARTTPVPTATLSAPAPGTSPHASPAALPDPGVAAAAVASSAAADLPECRVLPPDGRDHDTLWDIAERHLGDGMRWREIFALNQNRLMPDGQHLTKASLIHPGWILTLPADAVTLDLDHVPPAAPSAPAAPRQTTAAPDAPGQPAVPHLPAPAAGQTTDRTGASASGETTRPQPSARAETADPADSPPTGARDVTAHHDGSSVVAPAALGTLALASLGLLGALTRRRKVAARRRPVGTRPQLPDPELLEQEQRIRHEARLAEATAATVRLALLLAAKASRRSELKALWQHPDGSLELLWTEPAACRPVPAPFQASDAGWLLPVDAQRFLYATHTSSTAAQPDHAPSTAGPVAPAVGDQDPVPLLTPIGQCHGSALLVNLELYGAITLRQPSAPGSALPAEVLTAWMHQLASAPWAGISRIHVPRRLADTATGFDRISVTDQVQPPVTLLPEEAQQIAARGSVAAARHANPDLHEEDLTVYAGHHPAQIPTDLLTAATARQLPVTLLLLEPCTAAHAWTLDAHGLLTIPGLAADLTPSRLDAATQQRLLRLLEHAQDPPHADPAAPALTRRRELCPPDLTALATPAAPPDVSDLTGPDQPTAQAPGAGATDDEQIDAAANAGVALAEAPADRSGKTPNTTRKITPRTRTGPIEIAILGPVTLSGLDDALPRRVLADLLIYLAFHRRPLTSLEMWNGLWPHKPYQDATLRGRRSELNQLIHPLLRKGPGNRFWLDDLVHTDWQRFQALADGNPTQQLAALKLIRGRPFDNCQQDWMHLEGQITEIEAAATDLALTVGQRALTRSDYATARTAAHAGLLGAPFEERLYRLAMHAAAADGATGEVHQLQRQLNIVLQDELEPDDEMQPATIALLQHLSDRERRPHLSRPPADRDI
jgi:DNA-binding SARP family transcriptional activator